MQTIQTKFLGATHTKGERIKATTSAGVSLTIPYDYGLTTEKAHQKAAQTLLDTHEDLKYWHGTLVGGGIKCGMIFVFEDKDAPRISKKEGQA
jgi:hypothetical protein